MEIKPGKYILSLEQAKKSLQLADHLVYVTYPIVKENKLLAASSFDLGTSHGIVGASAGT